MQGRVTLLIASASLPCIVQVIETEMMYIRISYDFVRGD